jgi:hypothetical protein
MVAILPGASTTRAPWRRRTKKNKEEEQKKKNKNNLIEYNKWMSVVFSVTSHYMMAIIHHIQHITNISNMGANDNKKYSAELGNTTQTD